MYGFRKYFFLFTIRKGRSVAFQPCITLGCSWGQNGLKNNFLPKSSLKTLIFAVMVLDEMISEWPWTQKFELFAF